VFQQDSPETPAHRREVVVATLATALHRLAPLASPADPGRRSHPPRGEHARGGASTTREFST